MFKSNDKCNVYNPKYTTKILNYYITLPLDLRQQGENKKAQKRFDFHKSPTRGIKYYKHRKIKLKYKYPFKKILMITRKIMLQ